MIKITCKDGLDLQGNSTIVCQADGTWSDNPVCDDSGMLMLTTIQFVFLQQNVTPFVIG